MEMSTYADGSETPVGVSIEDGCPPIGAAACDATNHARVTLEPEAEMDKIMLFSGQRPDRTRRSMNARTCGGRYGDGK